MYNFPISLVIDINRFNGRQMLQSIQITQFPNNNMMVGKYLKFVTDTLASNGIFLMEICWWLFIK